LRAFTAADRKTIKQAAENYPETEYYQTAELLTQLGIGEALVTALNEKGIPTPLLHTMLVPPRSRMDVLSDAEIDTLVNKSKLVKKYANDEDRESACEILTAKLEEAAQKSEEAKAEKEAQKSTKTSKKEEKSTLEKVLDSSVTRQIGRTAANIITRSLLGALGLGGKSSSRKKSGSWF
jgi:predicted flap endonuclease-1-like 5' DNA nuclease